MDTGIDVVAFTKDGEYWAIQCKFYDNQTYMNKPAVDSFLSTSSRTFRDDSGNKVAFNQRIWVATTNKWGKNALEAMNNQVPPCLILYPNELAADETVDWEQLVKEKFGQDAQKHIPRKPKPHQVEALERAHNYYADHDRGKMIMACGTGKTFTSLRLVEQETQGKGLILVLVPSIALINQTLNEWNNFANETLHNICVCSDRTASQRKNKENDHPDENPNKLALPASTNYRSLVRQLVSAHKQADGMTVVYSTYQSIDVVSEAQKILNGEKKENVVMESIFQMGDVSSLDPDWDCTFDYIVCDEAHRTTGQIMGDKESDFTKVHHNDFIKARKRLYMTATPRLYQASAKKKAEENSIVLCSMDDPAMYGEEFYRIGFGKAVEMGLLSDYKVLILTVRDNLELPATLTQSIQDPNQEVNVDEALKLYGCMDALSKRVDPSSQDVKDVDPGLMHRAVAFCSKIAASKAVTATFNAYSESIGDMMDEQIDEDTVRIQAKHIDGGMDAGTRNDLIQWLNAAPTEGNECRMLTNVRCLSEGVDVPALDAVIFLSARNSQVDVVQSVGRVMRRAPGKKYGYIIIPVVVPSEGEPEAILDKNKDYQVIWSVLNALRAHDDRFNANINKIELNEKRPTGGGTVSIGPGSSGWGSDTPPQVQEISLFEQKWQDALYAKMVRKVGNRTYWEQWANDVAEIAMRHKARIKKLIAEDENYKTGFQMFMEGLQKNINPNITEETAIEMLSQHMVTKPVFDALFGNSSFTENNPISKAMKKLLDLVGETAYEKDQEKMRGFYKSVQDRCAGIDNASGKQKIIIELYDKFFKTALSTTVEKLGIVYTPIEVVDFINQSVADILKKEFNRTLNDENIHIIDPFTGTGTFIVRMLQSGLITPEAMERKYKKELHANEIVLLAYYIASVNIENAYHDIMQQKEGEYTPFDGICLTDTFQLYEDEIDNKNALKGIKYSDVFPNNSNRVIEQAKVPMRVIVGKICSDSRYRTLRLLLKVQSGYLEGNKAA